MWISITLLLLSIGVPFLIGFIPFKKDVINKATNKITTVGWIYIILCIVAISAAVAKEIIGSHDMERLKSSQDNLKDSVSVISSKYDKHQKLDSLIGLAFDPVTNKLKVIDSPLLKALFNKPQIEEKPIIKLANVGPSPTFRKNQDSTWNFVISLKTETNVVAVGIKDKCVFVSKKGGVWSISGGTSKHSANETTTLQEDATSFIYGGKITGALFTPESLDTLYAYLKINYTNKRGKIQPPFRCMYEITARDLNQSLPQADEDAYNVVKHLLVGKKLW